MIADVLLFLKDQLNKHLTTVSPTTEAAKPLVDFVDGRESESVRFKQDVVSLLLVNLEEETTLRAPDPYKAVDEDGKVSRVARDIRMNLYVLFVARFATYETGLRQLSRVISHFQRHNRIDHQSAPGLNERIDGLVVELVTLPFSEQNEIWSALRTTYYPSVVYRVKLVIFRDEDPMEAGVTGQLDLVMSQ